MKPAVLIPDFVNSIDLASIKRDRFKLARLRSQWETLGCELHERELAVIAAVEAGVPVDGKAEVITKRRQNISWLTVVRRELGEGAIEMVKDHWPISFYKALQVA